MSAEGDARPVADQIHSTIARDAASIMASAGVKPTLKILYVQDYLTSSKRLGQLHRAKFFLLLRSLLPQYEVSIAIAEGPFEDFDGTSTHCGEVVLGDATKATKAQVIKRELHSIRVDLHISVI